MSQLAAAVTILLSASLISALQPGIREDKNCKLTVSLVTVKSEAIPSGDIDTLIVTGAKAGNTCGGKANSLPRCVYLYKLDSTNEPSYKGSIWPYVEVPDECDIFLDDSIPEHSNLRKDGMIGMNPDTFGLLVGGRPLYFYHGDPTGENNLKDASCYCNFGMWSSVSETGQGIAFGANVVE
eukprot:CFRG2546T1